MQLLVIIPARGGSKGIPGKNIKPLAGKPLICHAIDTARTVAPDTDICVTTDDADIAACVEAYGLKVPFMRPPELATDQAGSYGVLLHALAYYEAQGRQYDAILLLQPTSPFRTATQVEEALVLFARRQADMVISVKETEANPYYVLYEENAKGELEPTKKAAFARRQDCPTVYELNGAIYIIDPIVLKQHTSLMAFPHIHKYLMDRLSSTDLDTPLDWAWCEFLIEKGYISF